MYTNGSFDMVNTVSWKLRRKFTVIPRRILRGMFVEHAKADSKSTPKRKKKKLRLSQALVKKSKRRKILLGDAQAYSTPTTRTMHS